MELEGEEDINYIETYVKKSVKWNMFCISTKHHFYHNNHFIQICWVIMSWQEQYVNTKVTLTSCTYPFHQRSMGAGHRKRKTFYNWTSLYMTLTSTVQIIGYPTK